MEWNIQALQERYVGGQARLIPDPDGITVPHVGLIADFVADEECEVEGEVKIRLEWIAFQSGSLNGLWKYYDASPWYIADMPEDETEPDANGRIILQSVFGGDELIELYPPDDSELVKLRDILP